MRKLLVLVVLAGCSHDVDLEVDGWHSFEANDLDRARALYEARLEEEPNHARSAAGWALADLLLLPESPPIKAFVERWNQPVFLIETAIFGDSGLLAKEDGAGLGTIDLETTYRPTASASGATFSWNAPTVRTELIPTTDGVNTYEALVVTVRDSTNRTLELSFNREDIFEDDGVATPLVSGLSASIAEIDGSVEILEGDGASSERSSTPASGFVRFDRVDAKIALQLIDVVIPAFCATPGCTAFYTVSGRIEDEVSDVSIPPDQFPFGNVCAIQGPPFVNELVVAVDLSGRLDDEFLAGILAGLGDVFELQASRFELATADDTFGYTFPMRLFHIERDLPFNAADAAFFAAATHFAATVTELASQYRWWNGDLKALIREFDRNGGLVRDFDPDLTARNILEYTLEPRADFDLSVVRDRAALALSAFERALTLETDQPGIFDFRAFAVRSLSDQFAEYAAAARRSITSPEPLVPASAPNWTLHLKKFFDDPPRRSNIEARLGAPLVTVTAEPYELVFADNLADDWPNLLGLLTRAGEETPYLFSDAAFESLADDSNGGWPYFINLLVRDIIDFSL
jgi:hypothetical protein